MASRKNEPVRPIIVKKIIQQAHAGHHGGAWKVAYADFVTAMMAFFLLMWLLGATTEKQRKALADYFSPTLVQTKQESAGSNGFFGGDSIVSVDNYPHRAGQTGTRSMTIPRDATGGPKEGSAIGRDKERFAQLKRALSEKVMSDRQLRRFAKNIRFTDTREGLRIDLIDESDFSMFALGSDVLSPDAIRLLDQIGPMVRDLPNSIIIRGHTDASLFARSKGLNNWQLSTLRAEATRSYLNVKGIPTRRFARIEGVSDREPYIPADPNDARNRRISITLGWGRS